MFAASKTATPAASGYQISRSLRFNSADSTYLSRTPTSAGNQKTWTWSSWIKKNKNTGADTIFSVAPTAGLNISIFLFASNTLEFYVANAVGTDWSEDTSAIYRDPSAWYHVVLSVDTTQATAANRLRLYVNGVQQSTVQTYGQIPQNQDTFINQISKQHGIGRNEDGASSYADFYLAEVYFIDGQALTPSSFGETNAQTGVWQPKLYAGTYGTNGFYLNFSDNSNTTAATLGKDYSGNGNNWTPNNFSVTAGAGNDSLVDSPTSYGTDTGVGGTVRGNYATMNPNVAKNTYALTYANGNLQLTGAGNNSFGGSGISTVAMSSGKWYAEFVFTSGTLLNDIGFGIVNSLWEIGLNNDDFFWKTSYGYQYSVNANKANNNATAAYGATYTTNDVIGIAFDADAGTLTFYKNGTSQGTAFSSIPSGSYLFAVYIYGNTSPVAYANFGQRAFAYTAPSGFKALCTQNLPTPTIGATTATQAGKYFNPVLYTGNGGTNNITGVGFQPDWVWIKSRNDTYNSQVYDVLRGTNNRLVPPSGNAEFADTDALTSFNSDGFTSGAEAGMNANAISFVAWNWKANGTGSSNTSGSITSTVSANTTSGFSVVTYTNASSGTVGHGLGVAPAMVIYKDRTNVTNWVVLHQSLANMSSSYLVLNLTNAVASGIALGGSPTSSVIYTNTNIIQNGAASVAYCFAEVAGYSKFGSYTGNGSADGPFVFTGFRPAFVLTKRTDSTSDWQLMDSTRDTYNVANKALFPNLALAETTGYNKDFLSNGFKIRDSGASLNASGGTYIYMAFASAPLKFSLAR